METGKEKIGFLQTQFGNPADCLRDVMESTKTRPDRIYKSDKIVR